MLCLCATVSIRLARVKLFRLTRLSSLPPNASPLPPSFAIPAPPLRHSCESRGAGGYDPFPLTGGRLGWGPYHPATTPWPPRPDPRHPTPMQCDIPNINPSPPTAPSGPTPHAPIEERERFGAQQQGLVIPRHKNFSTCSCNATPQLQIRIPGGSPPSYDGPSHKSPKPHPEAPRTQESAGGRR